MITHISLLQNLPKMAWFAEINRMGDLVEIKHGSGVSINDDFIFEGTFDGELSSDGILDSCVCLGSGLIISPVNTIFITPSHTLEGLFFIKNGPQRFVTNSNVLAYHLAKITPSHLAIKKSWRIKYGLGQVPQVIEKTNKAEILKISYFNFQIDGDKVVLLEKRKEPDVSNFDEYYQHLLEIGKRLLDNLQMLNGKNWKLMGTVSTGFDSVACLAIAKKLGCDSAVTLKNGRGDVDDNGIEIAKSIGIQCVEYVRPFSELSSQSRISMNYTLMEKCSEFVAAGTLAEDVCYLPFEQSISETLLLTGFQADKSWGRHFKPSSNLERGDVSGSSMGEFRLRVGFVHWPVPYIGCRSNEDLLKITMSNEMSKYFESKNYNKPIPIRIAESVGIPRHLYGHKKKAASVLFDETPNALPVAIYRQQLKFGIRDPILFEYSECVDLCSFRSPETDFTKHYHATYGINTPSYFLELESEYCSEIIDIHVFGRTIALVSLFSKGATCHFDGLGDIISKISSDTILEECLQDYSDLHKQVLPKLRSISNAEKKYIHFRYLKTSSKFSAFYDEKLDYPKKINHYLGSIWSGEEGVV